jgi:glycosyltransferase involved in cell wall biosynthesis
LPGIVPDESIESRQLAATVESHPERRVLMPTLLSINNYHYVRGGAEAVFLAHNDIFQNAGWRVVPFSMQHEKNLPSEWQDRFVDEIKLGKTYGFAERLAKSARAMYSREAQRKIGDLVRDIGPDVAHCHNIYHHISPSILSTLGNNGIPVLLTIHDLKLACPAYRMMTHDGICERCKGGKLYQAALNRCMHDSRALSVWVTIEAYLHRFLGSYEKHVTRFVVPSRFYLQKMVEWGWAEDRFEYIPNFVDADEIYPNFSPGTRYTYFGRLSGEKGIATLIKASVLAGAELQIIGTGPDEQALKALAERLDARVEFTGFVSGEALFDRLRDSRAIVLPSEWYENAPISLLEAFAAGKPVIGADIGGIPELITEERGRTFKAFSEESLAASLVELTEMQDSELEDMGKCAREYVSKVHSRQSYFDRCESVYTSLT